MSFDPYSRGYGVGGSDPGTAVHQDDLGNQGSQATQGKSFWGKFKTKLFSKVGKAKSAKVIGRSRANAHKRTTRTATTKSNAKPSRSKNPFRRKASRSARKFQTSSDMITDPKQGWQPGQGIQEEVALQEEVVLQPGAKASSAQSADKETGALGQSELQLEGVLGSNDAANKLGSHRETLQSKVAAIVGGKNGFQSQTGLLNETLRSLQTKCSDRYGLFDDRAKSFKKMLKDAQNKLDEAVEKVDKNEIDHASCIELEQELQDLASSIELKAVFIHNDDKTSANLSSEVTKSLRAAAAVLSQLDFPNDSAARHAVQEPGNPSNAVQGPGNLSNSLQWQNISRRMVAVKEQLLSVKAGQPERRSARHPDLITFNKHNLGIVANDERTNILLALGRATTILDKFSKLATSQANDAPAYSDHESYEMLVQQYRDKDFKLAELQKARLFISEDDDYIESLPKYDEKDHYSLLLQDLKRNARELDREIGSLRRHNLHNLVSQLDLERYSRILQEAVEFLEQNGYTE